MKKVKRSYYNKRLGKFVTKTYTYNKSYSKSTRGKTLVTNSGKVNVKNLNKVIEEINNSDLTYSQKLTEINNLKATVSQRAANKKKLTTSGYRSIQHASSSVEVFLSNVGWTADEVASRYGIPVEEVLNQANWSGNIFECYDNNGNYRRFRVRFDYYGDVLVEV